MLMNIYLIGNSVEFPKCFLLKSHFTKKWSQFQITLCLHITIKPSLVIVFYFFNKTETWLVLGGSVITAGLVLKFLHKMSLYSGIYDRRRKIRVKCSHETADKFLNTSTNRHLLYAYGYMLNQGKFYRLFISVTWLIWVRLRPVYTERLRHPLTSMMDENAFYIILYRKTQTLSLNRPLIRSLP